MAATVTMTVEQLQDLLQGHTAQVEKMMTLQIAALQSNLEKSFDEKLQTKFEEAERSIKQFMKESIDEEDPEESENSKVSQELRCLKDQVMHMEQSVSRIVSIGDGERGMDVSGNSHSTANSIKLPTVPSINKAAFSHPTSANGNPQMATQMEKLITDCCERLEEIVEQRTSKWEQQLQLPPPTPSTATTSSSPRSTPRRTKSMDMGSGTSGTVAALRASQQHMEDLIETRLKSMEQFIDNRHAELEAYYSSSNDTLKKIFVEIVQGIPSSNSLRSNNGGSFSSMSGHALTREELIAVLDDRIMSEKANGTRPITKDELEAILDARIHDDEEMDTRKPLTREELESVLDARINAVEEEEEEEKRAMLTQGSSESHGSAGGRVLLSAMEKLILHVKELIEIHSSTDDLEQQVKFKLEQLEGGPSNFQRIDAKLESIEKLVLASMTPRKKQRSTSKKPSRKLSQVIAGKENAADDTTTKARVEDSSSKNENVDRSNRASCAYSDVSVDEEGVDDSEEKEETNEAAGAGGDRVKSFMNTLSNWRHLNDEQHDVRDHGVAAAADDDIDEGDRCIGAPSDAEEGDDDIDSMDMSVDSSVGDGEENTKVLEMLQRLESKLDQLQEDRNRNGSVDEADHSGMPPLMGGSRDRSTNARHSREILLNADSISESIREEHSKLKQWIMEQQDEANNSERGDRSNGRQKAESDIPSGKASFDPKVLQSIQEKMESIENLATKNRSLLEDLLRKDVPAVPKELPMLEPLGGNGTMDLEKKILSHLDNMDKSVQFKLDEIYKDMQSAGSRRESEWSTMSSEDQAAVVAAIQKQLEGIREAIVEELRDSIPDYGMAQSMLRDNLQELREIVSEVAISEVELLKTQLGVAEEAEQEALHAIVVLREQLEQAREAERRALYMPRAAPQAAQSPTRNSVGMWNLGPFGQLLGQQLSAAPPKQYQTRRNSTGQQSQMSGLSHQSASRGLNFNSSISGANKFRSPKQKLEDWKNQIVDLDEKASDLRMLYTQLRGQQPGEWMEQGKLQLASELRKSGMQSSARLTGETKEMEVEVEVDVGVRGLEREGSSEGDEGGDWI